MLPTQGAQVWSLVKELRKEGTVIRLVWLCNPVNASSSVFGISQARILEWVAISFSRGSSRHRDWTIISLMSPTLAGRFFTTGSPGKPQGTKIPQKKKRKKELLILFFESHVLPWLIHVSVWQKPLQYCKVIGLQLIKINGKKKSHVLVLLFKILKLLWNSAAQLRPEVCGNQFWVTPHSQWFLMFKDRLLSCSHQLKPWADLTHPHFYLLRSFISGTVTSVFQEAGWLGLPPKEWN